MMIIVFIFFWLKKRIQKPLKKYQISPSYQRNTKIFKLLIFWVKNIKTASSPKRFTHSHPTVKRFPPPSQRISLHFSIFQQISLISLPSCNKEETYAALWTNLRESPGKNYETKIPRMNNTRKVPGKVQKPFRLFDGTFPHLWLLWLQHYTHFGVTHASWVVWELDILAERIFAGTFLGKRFLNFEGE